MASGTSAVDVSVKHLSATRALLDSLVTQEEQSTLASSIAERAEVQLKALLQRVEHAAMARVEHAQERAGEAFTAF